MAEIFAVETRGIGKPDYSKEISSGKERAGLTLAYILDLEIFGIVFSAVYTGTHTAVLHATIMTDAAALFIVNSLVGLTIVNVTDGSSGIIVSNTANTVSVLALTGGFANVWNLADVYNVPSPFAWVQAPLAPGAMAHYVDNVTGLAMPFTVPIGYTATLVAGGGSFTEDAKIWVYLDGYLVMSGGVISGGTGLYENRVVGITTATLDPVGDSAHTIDIQITNRGVGNLEGGVDLTGILEDVDTTSPAN